MKENAISKFLETLNAKLPAICADKDLIKHLPTIFKNHCTLTRMRQRGQAPVYFSISPKIYYLKDDVISWLRSRYNKKDE